MNFTKNEKYNNAIRIFKYKLENDDFGKEYFNLQANKEGFCIQNESSYNKGFNSKNFNEYCIENISKNYHKFLKTNSFKLIKKYMVENNDKIIIRIQKFENFY